MTCGTRASAALACLGLVLLFALACDERPAQSRVRYFSSPALGAWPAEQGGSGGLGPSAGDEAPPIVAGTGGAEPLGGQGGAGGTSGVGGQGGAGGVPDGTGGASGMNAGEGGAAGNIAGEGGAAGNIAGEGGAAGMGVDGVSALRFSVLTRSLGGKYSPKNIGAIWVADAQGAFVKTLAVWAATRARYLTRWNREARGSRVDAVTSATLRQHVVHDVSWDLTDVSGARVPGGDYAIIVEITDHDGTGDDVEVPFTLGAPETSSPADAPHFVDMSLVLE